MKKKHNTKRKILHEVVQAVFSAPFTLDHARVGAVVRFCNMAVALRSFKVSGAAACVTSIV